MSKLNKQCGFTLLELMLVIAIITVISMIGIAAYRQQFINFQVDKTALQMQQWLEGAAAYYVQNNKWPASPSTSCTINQLLEGNTSACGLVANITYVTAGSIDQNPWQQSYTLIAPPSLAAGAFTVATNAPISLAKRVAARLPNASVNFCTSSTCLVIATIAVPGQGNGGFNVVYASDELIDGSTIPYPGTTSDIPACPANTHGHLDVSIAQFSSPLSPLKAPIAPAVVQTSYTAGKNQWTVHILSQTNAQQNNAGRIFALVRCVPNSPLPVQNAVNSNNFIY